MIKIPITDKVVPTAYSMYYQMGYKNDRDGDVGKDMDRIDR
jgi:hypothetical protein